MTMCSRLRFAFLVAVVLGGLSRPLPAATQTNYANGAACQPAKFMGVLPSVTYNASGIWVDTGSADLICPITWSKQPITPWQNLAKVDIQVDWLGLPSTIPPISSQTWGCSLAYQSPGGSLTYADLPISYPIPTTLVSVAYAVLLCTVPASMGVQGYSVNMCFTSPSTPSGCG